MVNTFIELCKHKNIKYLITGMSNKCMPNVFEYSGRDDQPFNGLQFPVFDTSNFIFVNDPSFNTLRLYDIEGNIINVNSWIECANYVNGGWTNSFNNFSGDTFLIVITVGITISYFISKKFLSGRY